MEHRSENKQNENLAENRLNREKKISKNSHLCPQRKDSYRCRLPPANWQQCKKNKMI